MGIFEGKVAIITGGGKAKSIGYGVATAYAKEGANLVITGRNEQKLIDGKEELERSEHKAGKQAAARAPSDRIDDDGDHNEVDGAAVLKSDGDLDVAQDDRHGDDQRALGQHPDLFFVCCHLYFLPPNTFENNQTIKPR